MAQRFKAKTLLSNSGRFNNEVIAPNLVYNTGTQIISGTKIFSTGAIYLDTSIITAGSGTSANAGIGGVGGNIYLDGGSSSSIYGARGGDGGFIDLRGGGLNPEEPEPEYQIGNGGNGGFIQLRGGGITQDANAGAGGSIQANGGYRSNAGYIQLNAGGEDSHGGYIQLNGGGQAAVGGYIEANAYGSNGQYLNGGFINLNSTESGSGGYINLSSNGGVLDLSKAGGDIISNGQFDQYNNITATGGSINLSNNGGNISSIGSINDDNFSYGGSINLNAGNPENAPGGSINLAGGQNEQTPGGSINLSNGGGSINLSHGGGSIVSSGVSDGGGFIVGGSINLSSAFESNGGSINLSAGQRQDAVGGTGGSIDLSSNDNAGLYIKYNNPSAGVGTIFSKINDGLYIKKYNRWDKVLTSTPTNYPTGLWFYSDIFTQVFKIGTINTFYNNDPDEVEVTEEVNYFGNLHCFLSGDYNSPYDQYALGGKKIYREWPSSVFRYLLSFYSDRYGGNDYYYELAHQYSLKVNNFNSVNNILGVPSEASLTLFSDTQNPTTKGNAYFSQIYIEYTGIGQDTAFSTLNYLYKLPSNYWILSGVCEGTTAYTLQSTNTGNSLSTITWPGNSISLTNNSKTWILKYIYGDNENSAERAENYPTVISQNTNSNWESNITYDWFTESNGEWSFRSTSPYNLPAIPLTNSGSNGSTDIYSKIDHTHPIPKNLVYNTGNQIISGIKNFTNNLVIQDNLLQISKPSGYLTGIGYSGNYDGGYFLGTTKLSQNTSRLVDSNFGSIWTAKQSNRAWYGISISSDGKYQTAIVNAGQIYVSTDYGNTWAAKDINRLWWSVSISSDGKYQTAVVTGGFIYISSDYGNTWTFTGTQSGAWNSVSISSDGKYQSATISGGGIYISNNYGNTWTRKNTNTLSWNSISISNDGKYQSATAQNGNIYISNDYGDTWAAKATSKMWQNISISSDGKYQTAVGNGFEIYISADYGNTWVIKDSSRNWSSISISSNGKYQTALAGNDGVYVSIDYGNTWTLKRNGIGICYEVSISSDGKYQSLVSYNGQIYISKTDELIDGNLYADNLVYNTSNQTISGVKAFIDRPTVNGTGILLSGEAGQISNTVVQTSGTQTISGSKTFTTGVVMSGNLQVSGTGYFNALDLSNMDTLNLSGVDITITSGVVTSTNSISAINLVYNTGNQTISGVKTFATGVVIPNVVYNTGTQTVSGIKTFATGIVAPNVVYNTGIQSISGVKTFASPVFMSNISGVSGSGINIITNFASFNGDSGDSITISSASGATSGGNLNLYAGNAVSTPGNLNLSVGRNNASTSKGTIYLDGNIQVNPFFGAPGSNQHNSSITIYKTGTYGSASDILTIDQSNAIMELKNGLIVSGLISGNTLTGVFDKVYTTNLVYNTGQILNTTYSNLTGLIASNGLFSGQLYRISDFILKWNNQSINDQTVKSGTVIEPLIVTALSKNKIYHIAQSETYPQDTIYYNIDASGSYSWGQINNNAAIPNFKGWIYRRIDNILNIDIPYDWRNITVNCCKPDVSSVPNYSGNYQYTRLNFVKETGNNSNRGKLYYSLVTGNSGNALTNTNFWTPVSDFVESGTYFPTEEGLAFVGLYDEYNVGDFIIQLPAIPSSRIQQPTFTSTFTGLGTFLLNNTYNIKIKGGHNNVMFGSNTNNNTIGNNCFFNLIAEYFYANTIGDFFYSNMIGRGFNNNTIGINFSYNNIGDNFFFNALESSNFGNTISSQFAYNKIGNVFNTNFIGSYFNINTIGNYFYQNFVGNSFATNNIGNSCYTNMIGAGAEGNIIGNNFHGNTTKDNFYDNTIGNYFAANTIGFSFGVNTIGNYFNSNTIGNYFNNNTIGNNFQYNTIGSGFIFNTSEDDINNIVFTSSTHVYSGYNTTLFKNASLIQRLRYFNSSDQLIVTNPES